MGGLLSLFVKFAPRVETNTQTSAMKTTLELKAVVGINRGPPNSGAYFMKDNTSTSNDNAVVMAMTMSPAGPFRIPAPYVGVRLMDPSDERDANKMRPAFAAHKVIYAGGTNSRSAT